MIQLIKIFNTFFFSVWNIKFEMKNKKIMDFKYKYSMQNKKYLLCNQNIVLLHKLT